LRGFFLLNLLGVKILISLCGFKPLNKREKMMTEFDHIRQSKVQDLRRMKLICAFLLLVCIMTSVALEYFAPQDKNVIWVFVKGFFEAAIVGAMADWYAVVALFKHPLNMSFLPHTAIIPKKKDEIGKNLGKFLLDNFMQDDVITNKIKGFDPVSKLFDWIEKSETEYRPSNFIKEVLMKLLDNKNTKYINEFARKNIVALVNATDAATILSKIMSIFDNDSYRNSLVNQALGHGLNFILENKERWIEQAKAEGTWGTKWIGGKYVDGFIEDVIQKIIDIQSDANHPIKIELKDKMRVLIHNLQHDPKTIDTVNRFKIDLLENEHFLAFINSSISEIKDKLLEDLGSKNSFLGEHIHLGLMALVQKYRTDNEFNTYLNDLVGQLVKWLLSHKKWIAEHLSTQIQSWSPQDMSKTLELEIGSDLQWIRISGTLVGGLVGGIFSCVLFFIH